MNDNYYLYERGTDGQIAIFKKQKDSNIYIFFKSIIGDNWGKQPMPLEDYLEKENGKLTTLTPLMKLIYITEVVDAEY